MDVGGIYLGGWDIDDGWWCWRWVGTTIGSDQQESLRKNFQIQTLDQSQYGHMQIFYGQEFYLLVLLSSLSNRFVISLLFLHLQAFLTATKKDGPYH